MGVTDPSGRTNPKETIPTPTTALARSFHTPTEADPGNPDFLAPILVNLETGTVTTLDLSAAGYDFIN